VNYTQDPEENESSNHIQSEIDDEMTQDQSGSEFSASSDTESDATSDDNSSDSNDSEDDEEEEDEDSDFEGSQGKKSQTTPIKKSVSKKKANPRAPSAYNFYTKAAHQTIKQNSIKNKTPELTFAEKAKQISADWKAMTKEDKKQYEDQAVAAKLNLQNVAKSNTLTAGKNSKRKKLGQTAKGKGLQDILPANSY